MSRLNRSRVQACPGYKVKRVKMSGLGRVLTKKYPRFKGSRGQVQGFQGCWVQGFQGSRATGLKGLNSRATG